MAAILHKEPEPIPGPPELMKVVKRCLRKSPADRFQTMAEVRLAIEAAKAPRSAQPG